MTDRIQESCWIKLDAVGTCWNSVDPSNDVGSAVLSKKCPDLQIEVISGFVGTVGTVGRKNGVPKNWKDGKHAY